MDEREVNQSQETLEDVVETSSVADPRKAHLKEILFNFLNFLKTIALVVILAFIIRFFIIQPFIVEGLSMEPTFQDRDYLITEKISYRFGNPQRGEVVIFHPPGDNGTNYIKRVVGLPGDQINIKGGDLYINGQKILEPYLKEGEKTNLPDSKEVDITLKPNEFYLMGDNRGHSRDSRDLGAIPKSNIVSHVWFRLYPLDNIKTFPKVNYLSSY